MMHLDPSTALMIAGITLISPVVTLLMVIAAIREHRADQEHREK